MLKNISKSLLLVISAFLAMAPGASQAIFIPDDFTVHVVVPLVDATDGMGFDIKILEGDVTTENTARSVAVWAKVGPDYYNIGSHQVIETTTFIPLPPPDGSFTQSQTGVWSDPFGGSGSFQDGWVVHGGSSQGLIDFADFFGPGKLYSSINLSTLVVSEIVLAGYYAAGENFDSDGIVVYYPAALVPVPAAVWLFGSGLVGLVATGRRRKKLTIQAA